MIDKIYLVIVNHCFCKFATELRPLIDFRIWFLLHILRANRQIEIKFCIHIIIDKIYIGNVNLCFSQIINRVTALDYILRMNGQDLTKFCLLIVNDKIFVRIVIHHQFFKKHLCPCISLSSDSSMAGYSQIL